MSKDFYAPQIPLPFALQRNQFGFLAGENLSEADAAHLRAGRRKAKEPLRRLLDVVLPELAREEGVVAAIDTEPGRMKKLEWEVYLQAHPCLPHDAAIHIERSPLVFYDQSWLGQHATMNAALVPSQS